MAASKKQTPPTAEIPVVILCGGLGTRLREETERIPKPLISIGERPIVWHIMKIYYAQGFRKFILLLGYKGEKIKEYFYNYALFASDFTLRENSSTRIEYLRRPDESWEITFLDTGPETQTGGRIKQLEKILGDSQTFMLTYGDGVADVRMDDLLKSHYESGRLATLTAVVPPGRFGELAINKGQVTNFMEKPERAEQRINGGFFAVESVLLKKLNRKVDLNFEKDVLPSLASDGQLGAFLHNGYWQCMDTLKDVETLNTAWRAGKCPWKIWQ